MFKRLFNTEKRANRAIADTLYAQIVAMARQPVLYSDWEVPDTPLGRFEMVSLAIFLFLHRIKGQGTAADALGQELTDTFFLDVDHSLRELGIGDMGVPKRMKKLARMYFGRTVSYEAAINADNVDDLAEALRRNVNPERTGWPQSRQLARYAIDVSRQLAAMPLDELLAGRWAFLQAEEVN